MNPTPSLSVAQPAYARGASSRGSARDTGWACGEATVPWSASVADASVRRADMLALSVKAALERLAVPLARAAAALIRHEAWFVFGYARLEDHARERFARSARWARDLAALGLAIEKLPELGDALTGDDGGGPLGRVATLLVSRVATPESAGDWISLARRTTVRVLRAEVRGARAGGSAWPVTGPVEDRGALAPRPVSTADDMNNDDADGRSDSGAARRRDPLDDDNAAGGRVAGPGDGQDDDDRTLVRLLVPAPVAAAFDETLDLYRAIEGHDATVTSFVEALVADAAAGPRPIDFDAAPLSHGDGRAAAEEALARSTHHWGHLEQTAEITWAMALADASLSRFRELAESAGEGGPIEVDMQIRELVRMEDHLEMRLGDLLAGMASEAAWSRLRFAGAAHYAEQRLGLCRTTACNRLRASRGLRSLPMLRLAYESGEVALEASLHIARILMTAPEDRAAERTWIDWARDVTVKRVRDQVRALGRRLDAGSTAGAAQSAGPTGHPSGEPIGTTPAPQGDAEWHASLRREAGDARERVARLGARAAAGSVPDVFLRLRLPPDLAAALASAVESARRHASASAAAVPCDEPWPHSDSLGSVLAARRYEQRCRRAPAWVGLLSMLEEFVAAWDPVDASARRGRAAVHARDGWRCTAPGCTSRRNLEEHHIVYRARGGGDVASNLTCLCRFHHQKGEHGGLALCRGVAPLGIVWRLGRGTAGVWFRNERRLTVTRATEALEALEGTDR